MRALELKGTLKSTRSTPLIGRREERYTRSPSQLVAKMGPHPILLTQTWQHTTFNSPCSNCTLDVWCKIITALEFAENDVYLPGQLRLDSSS